MIKKGQAMVVILVASLVLSISVPMLIYLGSREAVWTQGQKERTSAFHLAEAGIARGVWKIKERQSNWDTVAAGGQLAGYNNDVIYGDVSGGAYRVQITSAGNKTLRLVATGRDAKIREFRAIEVLIEKRDAPSSVFAPAVDLGGGARIFWGPLMSLGNITLSGSSSELYPRKMARGSITRSGGPVSYRNSCCEDSISAFPNTDNIEWWSYNSYPVPDTPAIDLTYYKSLAQSQGLYYTTDQTISGLTNTSSTAVRYFDQADVRFTGNKHFRGILIVDGGDLEFSGSGDASAGSYTVTPPAEAWKEYQKNTPSSGNDCVVGPSGGGGDGESHDGNYANGDDSEGDKDCKHQYPGDEGYHQVGDFTFNSGCVLHGNLGGAPSTPVSFKGFIYVKGGQISATGSVVIHGAVMVDQGGSWSSGNFSIFYDEQLEPRLQNVSFVQTSWKEIKPTPF